MKVDGCELCEAARMSTWYHQDGTCWVADCEACDVPIVVWNEHGPVPPEDAVDHMMAVLLRVAAGRFGPDGFSVDRVMRQIPDHFHAHARDLNRWRRRLGMAPPSARPTGLPVSRTTGPGTGTDSGP